MNITINISEPETRTANRLRFLSPLIGPPYLLKIVGSPMVGAGSQPQTEKVVFTVVFSPAVAILNGVQNGSPTLQGRLMNSQLNPNQDNCTLIVQNNPADGNYRILTLAFDNIPASWHNQLGAFEIYLVDSNNDTLAADCKDIQF